MRRKFEGRLPGSLNVRGLSQSQNSVLQYCFFKNPAFGRTGYQPFQQRPKQLTFSLCIQLSCNFQLLIPRLSSVQKQRYQLLFPTSLAWET